MPVLLDEAMEYLQDSSNQVLFVTCSGEMRPCDSNYEASSIRCKECMFSTYLITNKFKHKNLIYKKNADFLDTNETNRIKNLKFNYNSIDDIKTIEFERTNIGLGVVSSYVSLTRNLDPFLNKANRHFFDDSLKASALLSIAVKKMIDEFQPGLVCLFNGRYGGLRPVMEVCLNQHIETSILECTFSSNREIQNKVKFVNVLPHDIDKNSQTIENNWSEWGDKNQREKIASNFYIKRKAAEIASDNVYTGNQISDLLPENWDSTKRNFVIFNSSEDEFFCVGESFDQYKIFNNQIEGIQYLAKRTTEDPTIHLYLRIHPNLKNIKFRYHTSLPDIFKDSKNITVILANSPISTYSLIDNCEKVFVFGSTVGVESTYWGKPVILLGGAFYMHLNVAYYPSNSKELDVLIFNKLSTKPKIGSLKYALYIFGQRGKPFKHVNYNYKIINILGKKLLIPKIYQYKNSMTVYIFIMIYFRIYNSISHIIFKFFTIKKLMIENEN